ncbi:ATP-binding protein [Undibacterium fentianense]|uniref:histidine kinase n=1 Tax=Undibacterium fentianense TaxID=2828728 RepID=A0A941IE60_9BURK|nr:ATP-binding protein [Undibacterium fentianense]MBR7799067.1 PAS domain S-box protein [Undibacterium fentianense]
MNFPSPRLLEHESPIRRALARILPIIVFLGTGLATELILFEEQSRQDSVNKQNTLSHAGEIRALIESELNANIHLASGLVSYIKTHHGIYQTSDIEPWLNELRGQQQSIRNITLAPGNKIQTVIPRDGNESAIGLYYPDNLQQWPAIEKIMLQKKPVLVGPFELKQGGTGMAYRVPIYLQNGAYWGMLSTVLNADLVFANANKRARELDLSYAIVDLELPANSLPIYGSWKNAKQAIERLNIDISGRKIELQVAHDSTPTLDPQIMTQRFAGWGVALLLGFLIARTFHSYRIQTRSYLALKESQERFMRMFNTAPQGMALVDEDGTWLSVNPMLCSILGYSESELRQLPLARLSTQLTIDSLQSKWKGKHQTNLQFELHLAHRDGSAVTCIVSLALIDHDKLEKAYWIFQVIDISRSISAENLVQDKAQYTQTILDNLEEAILSADLQGKVLRCNPAAMGIWKQSEAALLSTTIFALLDNKDSNDGLDWREDLEAFIGSINEQIRHQKKVESRYFKREGKVIDLNENIIHIEYSISAIQQIEGVELILVVRDVSERKRLQMMQSEFVSMVSHELRTPLTSIIGSLKLIEGGIFGQLPESLARMIHIALQNGQQLALIINDILDMDKLAAGKMDFHLQAMSLNDLIRECLENNQSYARQYRVQFDFVPAEEDILVRGDSMRLQQVMSNLLSNAAKFSKLDDTIDITLRKNQEHATVIVRDYGDGVPESHRKKLFKKFSQADSSSTRQKGGTGLGLAICKELMEGMHGSIGFEASVSPGACFYITIPIQK